MFSEIKNKCFSSNQTKIQPLLVKVTQLETKPTKVEVEQEQVEQEQKKTPNINNKLISSYEEDYTRNNTEIMKLWQRN
jgi:hypothetical protein